MWLIRSNLAPTLLTRRRNARVEMYFGASGVPDSSRGGFGEGEGYGGDLMMCTSCPSMGAFGVATPGIKLADCMRRCSADAGSGPQRYTEFQSLWPPVATLGQSCTVEARVCRASQHACCVNSPAVEGGARSAAQGAGGMPAPAPAGMPRAQHAEGAPLMTRPLGPANSMACSPSSPAPAALLTLVGDEVLFVEPFSLPSASSEATTVRCRVLGRDVQCVSLLVGTQPGGWPTVDALQSSAQLPILPAPVREEMQNLIWSMMCEARPANVSRPAYDSATFQGPFSSLDPRLQGEYMWAWSSHFRPLAADLNYCLECMPEPGSATEVHYRYVLASMVTFLRDHDCWATLACLLAVATARGVVLLSSPNGEVLSAGDLSPEHMLRAAHSADSQQYCQLYDAACGTFCGTSDDLLFTCSTYCCMSDQSPLDTLASACAIDEFLAEAEEADGRSSTAQASAEEYPKGSSTRIGPSGSVTAAGAAASKGASELEPGTEGRLARAAATAQLRSGRTPAVALVSLVALLLGMLSVASLLVCSVTASGGDGSSGGDMDQQQEQQQALKDWAPALWPSSFEGCMLVTSIGAALMTGCSSMALHQQLPAAVAVSIWLWQVLHAVALCCRGDFMAACVLLLCALLSGPGMFS